jgi:TRAP-type C4-dicarboxylate transport system substrate-binding protein
MPRMSSGARLTALAVVVTAAVLAGGCTDAGSGGDKAGGAGEPIVLRMANAYGDLRQLPTVEYFVDRVDELSEGDVRIAVLDRWGRFASDAEQQVVRDVASGKVDVAWVGTRVFDTMGVGSFQALTSPMLVDSYALQDAVVRSGITRHMMRGLEHVDVVGLAVLADGLRKPIGVNRPLLGPKTWKGITFGTLRSGRQAEAIRALGATPAQVFGPERAHGITDDTIQGFEMNLWAYRANVMAHLAPYVTANVTLWPQMDVLVANPGRLAALTAEQRGWLQRAAGNAADRSATLADTDAQTVRGACDAGARFAIASDADVAGLREAFAPVYADLGQDPETKRFIERIQALKRSTPPGPGLDIPPSCTGTAPRQNQSTGSAPARLNGTYRYVLTKQDARKGGEANLDEFPSVTTVTLRDGEVEGGCFGAGATYSADHDRITFDSPEYGYSTTFTFSVDDRGNLDLTPVLPMDHGDAFQCSYKPWTKIE